MSKKTRVKIPTKGMVESYLLQNGDAVFIYEQDLPGNNVFRHGIRAKHFVSKADIPEGTALRLDVEKVGYGLFEHMKKAEKVEAEQHRVHKKGIGNMLKVHVYHGVRQGNETVLTSLPGKENLDQGIELVPVEEQSGLFNGIAISRELELSA